MLQLCFHSHDRNSSTAEYSEGDTQRGCCGLRLLAESSFSLDCLDLSRTGIDDEGIKIITKAISQNPLLGLKTLILSHNPNLTAESAKWVGKMLQKNASLTKLQIRETPMGGIGLKYILEGAILNKESSLSDILFCYCKIVSRRISFEKLPEDLTNSTLKKLDLTGCEKLNGIVLLLCEVLKRFIGLESLSIQRSVIDDLAISELAVGLKVANSLSRFDFQSVEGLGPKGMKNFVNSIKDSKSKFSINLESNQIGDEGLKHILQIYDRVPIDSLQNMNLTDKSIDDIKQFFVKKNISSLNVSDNRLTNSENGISSLLKIERLTDVDLSNNKQIGNVGVEKLSDVLQSQPYLKSLDLSGLGIGPGLQNNFWTSLFDGKPLDTLNLSKNEMEDAGIIAFSQTCLQNCLDKMSELRYLKINSVPFSSRGMAVLSKLIQALSKKCSDLRVELRRSVSEDSEEFLCEAIRCSSNVSFDLTINHFSPMFLANVCKAVGQNPKPGAISLRSNRLHVDNNLLQVLLASDHEKILRHLWLDSGTKRKIERMLSGPIPTSMSLGTTESMILDRKGIDNVMLRDRLTGWMREGSVALSKIVLFSISNNPIGDDIVKELTAFLKKTVRLEVLRIAHCGFTDDGLSQILEVLPCLKQLRDIKCEGNQMGRKSSAAFAKLLGTNVMGKQESKIVSL